MGAYASNSQEDAADGIVGEFSHPEQNDWITLHATACHLSLVEVERLWQRFQQLGSNERGLLQAAKVNTHSCQDAFTKDIFSSMMGDNETITFQAYLNTMKWAENAETMEKVRAIFHLLSSADSKHLTENRLQETLTCLYPDDSLETVERLTKVFLGQMDTKMQGYIDEAQFVAWIHTLPAETVSSILAFNILPPEITDAAPTSLDDNSRPVSVDAIAHHAPTDEMLQDIAEPVSKRDWHLVANKLGHTIDDISSFEKQQPDNKVGQVMTMLKSWRSREGNSAFVETLEKALRDSNMSDIALRLYP